ncbi:MAG: PadR family transcriptional regulator [Clostridia bacterium]|nr:PadR family transcriptional regulator [Clostridia bacterium]
MKISKELAKGSTALLVLSVLSRKPMYGYQIIRTVEVMSEDVFQMNEGTLYPILHSLENEGFLTSYWSEKTESARRRKYYEITPQGLKELESQKQEWSVYSSAVAKVLGGAKVVTT